MKININFKIADKKDIKKNINKALTETAFFLEGESKRQAPVDTGFLRNNILGQKASNYKSKVLSNAPYSLYVHEGTRKMKAQPYMKDAVKKNIPEIERIFAKQLTDNILIKI